MNILVCLNKGYIQYMFSLLNSILDNNHQKIDLYIVTKDITNNDVKAYASDKKDKLEINIITIDDTLLQDAPTTKRYPSEIYYRIFASYLLPKTLERILYLDCDIIVKGDLTSLYNMDFNDNLYIGTSNVNKFLLRFNQIKNKATKDSNYLNTGVLLMNLSLLRKVQSKEEVFEYIKKRGKYFTLPDQDIISTLYGRRTLIVDKLIYNLSDRAIKLNNSSAFKKHIDEEWVKDNTVIIHYYGKNKPWKKNYKGILKEYYDKYKA